MLDNIANTMKKAMAIPIISGNLCLDRSTYRNNRNDSNITNASSSRLGQQLRLITCSASGTAAVLLVELPLGGIMLGIGRGVRGTERWMGTTINI